MCVSDVFVAQVNDPEYTVYGGLVVNIVRINRPPVFNDLTYARYVSENSPLGSPVGVPVSAKDTPDDIVHLTFAVTKILPATAASLIDVNVTTGQLVVTGPLNFECDRTSPVAGCPIRTVTVTLVVSDNFVDGSLSSRPTDFVVSVMNEQEPPITAIRMSLAVDEFSAAGTVLTPVVDDPNMVYDFYDDDRTPLAFGLLQNPGGMFGVRAGNESIDISGVPKFDDSTTNQYPVFFLAKGGHDYFDGSLYTFNVSTTDGTFTHVTIVTVSFNNVPNPPRITPPSRAVRIAVDENSVGGAVAFTLTAVDLDRTTDFWYTITRVQQIAFDGSVVEESPDFATGAFARTWTIRTLSAGVVESRIPPFGRTSVLDYELYVGYNITVRCADRGDGAALTDFITVYVAVNDLNDLTVTSISTPNGPMQTPGGEPVLITGTNFGPVQGSPYVFIDVRYGCDRANGSRTSCKYTASACEVVVPNTVLRCSSAAGSGARHVWFVDVASQPRFSNPAIDSDQARQMTSYAPPEVRAVEPRSLLRTRGGDPVDLRGKNFGPRGTPVAAVFNGLRYSASCSVLEHELVTCITSPGVGAHHSWLLTVDGIVSLPSAATTSYAPPVISGVSGATGVNVGALETPGGETVYLNGDNFGPGDSVPSDDAVPFSLVTSVLYSLRSACRLLVPHVRIACASPEGAGAGFAWVVVVALQASDRSSNLTSFAVPALLRVYGDGAFGSPTHGGSRVYIRWAVLWSAPGSCVLPLCAVCASASVL